MDVQQKLDEIVAAVEGARSMPMSASCVVNRAELLAMLGELREALPGSLAQAEELLGGREQMVADARTEARRIIESAEAERASLISDTGLARHAQEEADRLLAQARQEAEETRAEADDYVDSKLANFEVVLSKTIGSVERGREKLLGSGPGAQEWGEEYAEDAPERTGDPEELRRRADAYVDARLGSVAAVLGKTLEAVGRGRQKLLGHQPIDELAAHLAAQDGADPQAPHTSDADFLAGLAATDSPAFSPAPAGPTGQEVPPQPPAPSYVPDLPAQEPVSAASADPYGSYYGQQQDPYAAHGQQPDPYAGYGQQHDPYAGYGQQQDAYAGYGQQQDPYAYQQPQHYAPGPGQPGGAQLDETSLFDTSMIDLEQVRRYEQGHGQGGQG